MLWACMHDEPCTTTTTCILIIPLQKETISQICWPIVLQFYRESTSLKLQDRRISLLFTIPKDSF